VAVFAAVVVFSGCDSSSSSSPAAVAGVWTGSGAYEQGTAISNFRLTLTQDGKSVLGSYSVTRTGRSTMTGSVSGSVSGSKLNLTLSPHGMADGRVDGNTMTLFWFESGFGGTGGGGTVTLSK